MRDQEQNFNNTPAGDEEQISHLLGSLERVETPGDFGFRVKGRIAARRQLGGRRRWLPASAAVAAPLGLALAVGGYFTLTTMYSPGDVRGPQVAEMKPASLPAAVVDSGPAAPLTREVSSVDPGQITDDPIAPVAPSADKITVMVPRSVDPGINAARVRTTSSRRPTMDNTGGGSIDQAGGISVEVPPKSTDANQAPAMNPAAGNTPVPAKSVLSAMGIDATYGSSWTVGSVRAGSSAARSGLKSGDVIEAVNGQPLSGATSFNGKFTGRSLRVRRDGKVINVNIGH